MYSLQISDQLHIKMIMNETIPLRYLAPMNHLWLKKKVHHVVIEVVDDLLVKIVVLLVTTLLAFMITIVEIQTLK